MNKREAKKFAYGAIGAFVDAEIHAILEIHEHDPDQAWTAADLQRLQDAMQEIANELIQKSW